MKSPKLRGIGEVVTEYGAKVMRIFEKGLLGRSLFDFYGDIKAQTLRTKESSSVPNTPVDGDGGVIYTKSADGKLYYKSNEVSEVELSSQGTNTTYSVSCVDGDNSDEEKIRLTGSDSSTDDVVLEAGTGLSIARDGDKITFTNTVTDTDTVLTTEQVQDIVGTMFSGNTETRISAIYDDTDGTINLVVDAIPVDLTVSGAGTVHTNNITDLHGAGIDGSAGNLLTDDGDGTVTSQSNLTYVSASEVFTLRSSTSTKPIFQISNSNTDAEAPVISLSKSTAGADGDDLGRIKFDGFDPDGNEQTFAQILGEIVVAADGSEEGKLTIIVASHDGEEQPGLILASGNAEDEVDVTIGNTTTSLTTISGDLQVNGNDIKDDDGTTCITFDSSGGTSIAKKLTVGSSQNEVLELNTTSATGSPFISFRQNGTRKSFIQHNDTSDTLKIASEFGAISLLTDSGGSETERLGINSSGDATFTGGLTVDGVLKSTTRRFTVTGNTDGTYDGDVVFIGGTTSMTTGAIYHYKSDGTWELADATDNTKSDGLLGVALGAASDTNGVLLRGMVTLDHDPGAVGDVLYLKTVAGDCSSTAPSGNGNIVRIIGYCLDASNGQIWFNPDNTFVEYTT